MASSLNRPSSWVLWYNELKSKAGPFHDFAAGELSELDSVPLSYVGDPRAFGATVATTSEDLVFIMVPGHAKRVNILHQCFAHSEKPGGEASVVGLWGPNAQAQFRSITSKTAVQTINLPTTTRGTSHPRVPTMEQFLKVNNAGEFASLEGDEGGDEATVLEMCPNSLWLHPAFYFLVEGTRGGRAADLAMEILQNLDGWFEGSEDAEELKAGAARTLEFLWAVEKGFTTAVAFGDPDESPGLDLKCRRVLNKIFHDAAPDSSSRPAPRADSDLSELNSNLIENIHLLSEEALKAANRKDQKTLLGRLDPTARCQPVHPPVGARLERRKTLHASIHEKTCIRQRAHESHQYGEGPHRRLARICQRK